MITNSNLICSMMYILRCPHVSVLFMQPAYSYRENLKSGQIFYTVHEDVHYERDRLLFLSRDLSRDLDLFLSRDLDLFFLSLDL